MMKRRARFDIWTFVLIAAWVILIVLLIWPLSSVLRASLIDNDTGSFSLVHYVQIATIKVYQRAIGNTLIAGFGGMTGALILGVTLAFVTTRFRIYGRALIQTLAVVALVSPPFIGAYAWIVLFGASGVVRKGLASIGISIPPLYGAMGVILVFAFKFFPHVFLITSGALAAINRSVEEAAESLGVSPMRRLFTITFPLILPAISASALLTFVLSIADFGTPRIIGRDFNVLATEAFTLYGSEVGGKPGMASALSIALIILSMIIVFGQRWVLRKNVYYSNLIKKPERQQAHGIKAIGLHLLAYAIVLIGALPAIIVVMFSFRRTSGPVFQPGLSLQSYERVISTVSAPIWNTLIFSSIAVVAIVITGTLIGYLISRRPGIATGALDALLMVPYVVPGLIIIMAIFVRRLPYSARSVAAALKQVGPNLEDAAVSLGYSPGKAFLKVTVPLILPGIMAGALMSFVTAMNELSSSLVLYVGSTITMPVRIYLSVMDGEYGTASALSTILLTMTVAAVYAAFHLSGRKESALL